MEDEILTPPTPTFFRFPDAAVGMAALDDAGLLTEDGDPIPASHSHALDVVGIIPECSGWHINYRGEVPDEWLQYAVSPEQPVRIWA